MTIQQVITNYQGKLFIEGKITRDIEKAKKENDELEKFMWSTYGNEYDFIQLETELLF